MRDVPTVPRVPRSVLGLGSGRVTGPRTDAG
jgi:hypothetical protein